MSKSFRKKGHEEVGSDTDEELYAHFNGFYVGDAGLKSSAGSMECGPGAFRLPEGYDNNVKFDPSGKMMEHGRLEATRVSRALGRLAGPIPEKSSQKQKLEWGMYYQVLRAYYTRLDPGTHDQLVGTYGEFAAVALVIPKGRAYVELYCRGRMELEIISARNKADEAMAVRAIFNIKLKEELEKELQKVNEEKPAGWQFKKAGIEKKLEAISRALSQRDSELNIRNKWSNISSHGYEALRSLVRRSQASKDTLDRQSARELQNWILYQARGVWRDARRAYAKEKRVVDKEMRKRHNPVKKEVDSFAATLGRFIPADED